MLRRLNKLLPASPEVVVGVGDADDAGVYRLRDDLLLVQTVDFFTPIVDDAATWGRISAANALSDIYAMGAEPLTALSIVGWPRETLPIELLGDVLEGGSEVLAAAGCALLGGHTIDDPEPKYGLAVTGVVHAEDLVTNAMAKAGDVLVLTKPLGTGVIATAIKAGDVDADVESAAVEVMTTLNAAAARAMRRVRVRAATDVTGFGLLGHLGEVVRASAVSARIAAADVPILPGVLELIKQGVVPSGTMRNLDSATRFTSFDGVPDPMRIALADAQTSGGLLLAVDAPLADALLLALVEEGVTGTAIGEVVERDFSHGPAGRIEVSN